MAHRRVSLVKMLFLAAALVIVAYLALVSVRSVIAYRDVIEAKDLLVSAEGTLDRAGLDVTSDQLDEVEIRLERARGKVRSASGFLSNDPALWVARRLPWVGGQINSARDLAQVGLDGAEIGMDGVQIMRKLLAVKDEGTGPLGQKAIRFLDDVEPEIERIEGRLGEMRAIQEELQSRTLIAPLSSAVDELDDRIARIQDLAETYRRAQVLAPGLLGQERPMTYLVLGQDNTEIAATGGLILSYGVITVHQGKVTDMFFEGTEEQIARWQELTGGEYVEPPAPLKRYLLRKWTWNLGTANWSPDFPTAARQAESFYLKGGGDPIDGVIAIDFAAMEKLLDVLGPIELPEYDAILDSGNITELVLEKTRRPQRSGEPKKAFAAAAAQAIIQKMFAVDSDLWGSLLQAISDIGEERHFLVFAKDNQLQRVIGELAWGGGIRSYEGDYLMIVDASLRSTKLNLVLEEMIRLDVAVTRDGSVDSSVTVTYRDQRYERTPEEYIELAKRLRNARQYGGYVRLFVPDSAELRDVRVDNKAVDPEEVIQALDRLVVGQFFRIPKSGSASVTFRYLVPDAVIRQGDHYEYVLTLQKQAGASDLPVALGIALPVGVTDVTVDVGRPKDRASQTYNFSNNVFEFELKLKTDQVVSVRYRLD